MINQMKPYLGVNQKVKKKPESDDEKDSDEDSKNNDFFESSVFW